MEQTIAQEKSTVFVTSRFAHLNLVMKTDQNIIVNGVVVSTPPRFIRFHPGTYGAGEYRTKDPEEVAFIKTTAEFKSGEIQIASMGTPKRTDFGVGLHSGTMSTGARAPEIAGPAPDPGGQLEVKAASGGEEMF